MCGIAGYINHSVSENIAQQMINTLAHRGPCDVGIWCDTNYKIALAHRRLAIVDLSPLGHQPMLSENKRYILVFNGEIYNHNLLRAELKNIQWRGHSDTEVILAAISLWGIEKALQKFVGMFAFALWDNEEKILTLARDRMGEKPLYYGFQNNTFLFASELKALKKHPDFLNEIDKDILSLYLQYGYIPTPYSIYKGIRKLTAGSYLQLAFNNNNKLAIINHSVYWNVSDIAQKGLLNPFNGTDNQAIALLDNQLQETIGLQMLADVPLGAFLSGGVDSSTIVALMQAQSNQAINTFSIGFDNALYNEAHYAQAIAQHLKTKHTELYLSTQDAISVIPQLPQLYDEPFADSSQIATFLVSKLAKQHVTVSLSGDGGDELFCGYNRYLITAKYWKVIESLPLPLRQLMALLIQKLPPHQWNKLVALIPIIAKKYNNIGNKLHKGARVLSSQTVEQLYTQLISNCLNTKSLLINHTNSHYLINSVSPLTTLNITERMMLLDSITYLPDDILVKVDRAAMGVSLETRVPFLDHRIIELAWQLPLNMKYREGQSKWILRQVLYQYVPKNLIERPKMGFALPIAEWLRSDLRAWAESLLNETKLNRQGYFNSAIIQQYWQQHLSGKYNWEQLLWAILMFQLWLEQN